MTSHSPRIRLAEMAHARSGDKGNRANVGVVAFDAGGYDWLVRHLTDSAVAEHFRPMGVGAVRRHELPLLHALNFVIDDALAGGASRSLRLDTQGKALAAALLEIRLPAPGDSPSETSP